jgi:hypothetical protein
MALPVVVVINIQLYGRVRGVKVSVRAEKRLGGVGRGMVAERRDDRLIPNPIWEPREVHDSESESQPKPKSNTFKASTWRTSYQVCLFSLHMGDLSVCVCIHSESTKFTRAVFHSSVYRADSGNVVRAEQHFSHTKHSVRHMSRGY